MMKTVLKEPLLYFLILAGGLFLFFERGDGGVADEALKPEQIVVTQGQVDALILRFEKVWQRHPTAREIQGLIDSHIREEVYYREALAMGLDQDDGLIRRRLGQKLQFLSEDMMVVEDPGDQVLKAYLDAKASEYRAPTRLSFEHLYLSPDLRGAAVESDAVALLEKLREHKVSAELSGDSLMVPQQFREASESEVERVLGPAFAQSLLDLPVGRWEGPVRSGYGLHLVRISGRVEGSVPELGAVRDLVLRDWELAQRQEANERLFRQMRSRYEVRVEAQEAAAGDDTMQSAANLAPGRI
ncbi:MAG: peptidyl-prolyl cis-trans isomerase [Oceanospirillaceae bacterium]|nr:peptidyl-prolyl cis-trans isomerase [Oceanospirillaceae bacterium]